MKKILLHLLFALFSCTFTNSFGNVLPSEILGENLVTGKKISQSLTDKTYKGFVIIFLSARCPCSNSHVPTIKKLSSKFSDYKFIAIHSNADESIEEAKKYFKEVQFSFEVIQDEQSKLANQFKAYKTPHVFLINSKGEIQYEGGVTSSTRAENSVRNFLEEALQDLSKGQKVRTPEGRTLGCVILREGEKNVW